MSPDSNGVVVTGLGPVTSIGVGGDAMWASLLGGRSSVSLRELPVDVAGSAKLPIAAMPSNSTVTGLDAHVGFLAKQGCADYRDLAYALLAIELAIQDAGFEYDRRANRVGVVQAFEAPGVERTVARMFELFRSPPATDQPPALYDCLAPSFYNMQAFLYVHLVNKAFGFHGFSTSVHNACSSGAFAIEVAAQQIRSGRADAMVVVGGESFDTAVRLEWFRRLEMYAHDGQMRPFDADSSGFYVGEGAAAIVLESASRAARREAPIHATYLGGAFAHQGWKQTIPDVRSATLRHVIAEVLAHAAVRPADIDLVVPHGASTLLCDGYEASCLAGALGSQAEKAVATVYKPSVGHMLAASSLIETIATVLTMKHQTVPATLRSDPDHVKLPVPLVTEPVERPVRTVLKLSTGFTGHDAASLWGGVGLTIDD